MRLETGMMPMGDDPLTYLLRKPVQQFTKGHTIYNTQCPSAHLYVPMNMAARR